jgi:methionyl-tRNA formyltransferase
MRIVFMGTPEFAVESLRTLVEGGHQVVGVVTMPDKPVGKHQSVWQPSPVKQYALSAGLPIMQPEKLKDEAFLSQLASLKADLQIVVAFRMLPEAVWNMPPLGTFNLHASLLPQYRGAAPINWAVINGETETGVTTFFLTHGMDTGKIILQKHIPIAETDDAGTIHDALMTTGAALVTETVDRILAGKAEAIPQEQLHNGVSELHPAPKLFRETCRIDWHQPLKKIYDFIRGLSPIPAAWTELVQPDGNRQVLKLYQTEKRPAGHSLPAGTVCSDRKTYIDVAVGGGYLRLHSLQLAGRKRMNAADFLNGFKQTEGTTVE